MDILAKAARPSRRSGAQGSGCMIPQTHPHPRIAPDGRTVIFSSDRTGYGNIYSVELAVFDLLPLTEA